MIISRRYVPLCDLVRCDDLSKEVIKTAYLKHPMPDSDKKMAWDYVCEHHTRLHNADLGSGILNIGYIKDQFKVLDQTHPFDNGYTYENVNKVQILDRSEDELTLELINAFDGYDTTIGIVTIKK